MSCSVPCPLCRYTTILRMDGMEDLAVKPSKFPLMVMVNRLLNDPSGSFSLRSMLLMVKSKYGRVRNSRTMASVIGLFRASLPSKSRLMASRMVCWIGPSFNTGEWRQYFLPYFNWLLCLCYEFPLPAGDGNLHSKRRNCLRTGIMSSGKSSELWSGLERTSGDYCTFSKCS